MDAKRFDAIAKTLATRGASRRSVMTTLAHASVAGFIGAIRAAGTAAARGAPLAQLAQQQPVQDDWADAEATATAEAGSVVVCHQGASTVVHQSELAAHDAHGDSPGACCPDCGTCEACLLSTDDPAPCGRPCGDPCLAETLCLHARHDAAYERLQMYLVGRGFVPDGASTAGEATWEGTTVWRLSTDFLGLHDNRDSASLIYSVRSTGERAAYALVYRDGSAEHALVVFDGGAIEPVVLPREDAAPALRAMALAQDDQLPPSRLCGPCRRWCEFGRAFACDEGGGVPELFCGELLHDPRAAAACQLLWTVVCSTPTMGEELTRARCRTACREFCARDACQGECEGLCTACNPETVGCRARCGCPWNEPACDDVECCNPCQYCDGNLGACFEKLDACPFCYRCNPTDGSCEAKQSCCRSDADCRRCDVCSVADGTCAPVNTKPGCCFTNADCGPCEVCSRGECVREPKCCTDQIPCGACEECVLGTCARQSDCCTDDAECGSRCRVCRGNVCQVNPDLSDCCSDNRDCAPCEGCYDNICYYLGDQPDCCRDDLDCKYMGGGRACQVCTDNKCVYDLAKPDCCNDGSDDCGPCRACSGGSCVARADKPECCFDDADCDPCQYCSQYIGVCLARLDACPVCQACDRSDGSCRPRVCEVPCTSCLNNACVADDDAGGCEPCSVCSGGACVPDPNPSAECQPCRPELCEQLVDGQCVGCSAGEVCRPGEGCVPTSGADGTGSEACPLNDCSCEALLPGSSMTMHDVLADGTRQFSCNIFADTLIYGLDVTVGPNAADYWASLQSDESAVDYARTTLPRSGLPALVDEDTGLHQARVYVLVRDDILLHAAALNWEEFTPDLLPMAIGIADDAAVVIAGG